jgi:ABC-type oligopeptide transport system substrate-binding subunit
MIQKIKSFNRDTAWLILLIALALAAAAVAVMGFKKRLRSEVATFQNKSEIIYGMPRMAGDLGVEELRTMEDFEILTKIHESLVSLDRAGRIFPGVAKNWRVFDGGKKINFYLRQNLEFASGKLFRCNDVLETFEHLKARHDDSLWAMNIVKSMECNSDRQFLVTLEHPSPFFLSEISDIRYSIRPSSSLNDPKPHLDGLGAYKVENYDSKSNEIVLVRRDNSPFATMQSPLRVHYKKIEDLNEAAKQLKDGTLDIYPLRGKLMDTGKLLVSSRPVDRVWMLVLSKNTMLKYPQFTKCLNTLLKRENIITAIHDPAFVKANTVVVMMDDDNGSQSRLLLGVYNSQEDDADCAHQMPQSVRLMTASGLDQRIIDSISHELKRLSIHVKAVPPSAKEKFLPKLGTDTYDIAILTFGASPSPVSDLTYFLVNNPVFPPSGWVDRGLSKLVQKISLSRNEIEAHERVLSVLGQSLSKSPLVTLFFEKERYLTGKCLKVVNPDRFLFDEHFASITRDGSCH